MTNKFAQAKQDLAGMQLSERFMTIGATGAAMSQGYKVTVGDEKNYLNFPARWFAVNHDGKWSIRFAYVNVTPVKTGLSAKEAYRLMHSLARRSVWVNGQAEILIQPL